MAISIAGVMVWRLKKGNMAMEILEKIDQWGEEGHLQDELFVLMTVTYT